MRHIPNFLTLLRLILIPFISWFALQSRYDLALSILLIAGFSDYFDGSLARKYQLRTRTGAILDPAADKFLMFFTFITLGYMQQLPYLLVYLVIGRDLYIVLGYLFLKARVNKIEIKPLRSSKTNTFCQLALLCFSLCLSFIQMHQWTLLDIFEPLIYWGKMLFLFGTFLFIMISTVEYTQRGVEILRSAKSEVKA